jgi:hypothetical protein
MNTPMTWRCRCGNTNLSHFIYCAACGAMELVPAATKQAAAEPKPEPRRPWPQKFFE